HLGMQRLHAAVEDLGKAGDVGDPRDRHPFLGELGRGAPGRDDLEAAGRELLPELDDAVLAVDGEERALLRGWLHSSSSLEGGNPCSGGTSWGTASRGVGWRVRSPRASRQMAIQVAAVAVTAREYDSEATPKTGERKSIVRWSTTRPFWKSSV